MSSALLQSFFYTKYKIKSELIKVLNELIIEQNDQLDYYRTMINEINNMIHNNCIINETVEKISNFALI